MTNDEQGLRKQLEQAAKAKSVLDSEAFQNASNAVRQAIFEAWEKCPIRDREAAHEYKLMLKIHADLIANLQRAFENGKFAAEELKRDKSIPQRIAERLRIV